MKPKGVTTQMKTLSEYILMVLFVLLMKRVCFLANETLRCNDLNGSSQQIHSNGTVCIINEESLFLANET